MTRPRRHLKDQVVMLTRRCFERRFFLRPDTTINAIAAYEFARAGQRHGVAIHAVMVMSNHPHLIVTDARGRRSDFMRDALSGIARARNADLGRRSYFWDDRPYCDTVLLERQAQERKLLYTWLNPVRAGLVERAEDWPGFKILPRDWGKPVKVPRPGAFYGRRSPEFIEFTPQPPPGYEDMSLSEVRAHFEGLLKEAEDEIRAERRRCKKRLVGVKRVLAVRPTSHPSTPAPMGQMSPRFASQDPAILSAAIARERAFFNAYARERERWLKGKKGVVFPCGTVWLRRNAPVKCRAPDTHEAGLAATM
ncbi:hypothetical protein DL240_16420 [Lujinxingia litoralis]|uniref:Transposase IS200-like domain-containing protein n=1 Tax=Lujinxingia litoralis TaxID=2211119 RepID=A0A328C7T2_9DELT|nr:hypothetical protein [Lujinxingia litoralis]RAL20615.1 hypothetical protein DL240_16420 [Lujinxingia litoralis]